MRILRHELGKQWRDCDAENNSNTWSETGPPGDSPDNGCVTVALIEVDHANVRLHAAVQEAAGTLPVSFPWIFIKGRHLGGLTELQALAR